MSEFLIKGQKFQAQPVAPGLYVVATPIGNLGDITIRAVETLAACEVIACEDTRVTAKLLRHYGIAAKTVSYNEHNAEVAGPRLVADMADGKAVALVSDAGTPLLSDPGLRLVEAARKEGIPVVPLPGASAPLAALVASGLPVKAWQFAGFLPTKRLAKKTALESIQSATCSTVFFESPNRVKDTLLAMCEVFGPERQVCLARELTKLHEEIITATIGKLVDSFAEEKCRGEFVLIVGPASEDAKIDIDGLLAELLETDSLSRAAAKAAELTGLSKRELYQRALVLKGQADG